MPITAEQVSDLVESVVTGRGFDLEDVIVDSPSTRPEITIVVDRDGGGDLDVLADLSREISAVLDDTPTTADEEYTLEVTSPGIDRPLTAPRHWRRARGRKVAATVSTPDGGSPRQVTGRIGAVDDGHVRIVANDKGRLRTQDLDLGTILDAVVQVDFSRPGTAELELCGLDPDEIARRRSDS